MLTSNLLQISSPMKRIFILFAVALMGIVVSSAQNIPSVHNDDVEQSRKYLRGNDYQRDLLLYVDMLTKTHPYYADAKQRAELNRRLHTMHKECGDITDLAIFRAYLEQIASSLNDGHTMVSYWNKPDRLFPVRLSFSDDTIAIIEVAPEYQNTLLGKEVTGINGKSLAEILRLAAPLISADNEVNFRNIAKEYMMISEFWSLLGMSDDTLELTLTDGTITEVAAVSKSQLKIVQLQKNTANRITAQRGVLFDYNIFEDESICYLQFNQFADRVTHPQYPQLARFDEFVCEMMHEMREKEVRTLVIDLQYNGGGNSTLGDVLLSWLHPYRDIRQGSGELRMSELLCEHYPHYRECTLEGEPLEMGKIYQLRDFDRSGEDNEADYTAEQDSTKHILNFNDEHIFRGNVIFVEGKDSFSSATLLLTTARDNGIGIIVGEISGGRPSHYGDILYCMLPNTQTIATVSHKFFVRPNQELKDLEYIYPDYVVKLNDPNRDLLWEWIVENYGAKK